MPNKRTPQHPDPSVARYMHLAKKLPVAGVKMAVASTSPETVATAPSIDIDNEIAREKKLKNDNIAQDIILKRQVADRLFILLGVETAAIFVLAFLQATRWPLHFQLENGSFKILVSATIMQITGMTFVVVRYLFPKPR
ncbi:MAG TPA: hypothetical protein VFT53_06045 [Candidatus Saccharimonadales bacterium]|nr:hypothetical protein [Candidatus Saccharimonadales bacterium]